MDIMERMHESIMRRIPTEVEQGDKFVLTRNHLINVMSLIWVDGVDACLDMQREQRAIMDSTSSKDQHG